MLWEQEMQQIDVHNCDNDKIVFAYENHFSYDEKIDI